MNGFDQIPAGRPMPQRSSMGMFGRNLGSGSMSDPRAAMGPGGRAFTGSAESGPVSQEYRWGSRSAPQRPMGAPQRPMDMYGWGNMAEGMYDPRAAMGMYNPRMPGGDAWGGYNMWGVEAGPYQQRPMLDPTMMRSRMDQMRAPMRGAPISDPRAFMGPGGQPYFVPQIWGV